MREALGVRGRKAHEMVRITVLGGTGYAGEHIVAEAARRGHTVVSYSRKIPDSGVVGVTYRQGDVDDAAVLRDAVAAADVVFSALSARGALSGKGKLRTIESRLARIAEESGTRLGVLGGAGSLFAYEGGPLVMDDPEFPEAFKAEAEEMSGVLKDLRATSEKLDWFFVSPAGGFGSYAPGEALGHYRVGGDVLLTDKDGNSFISGADLAMAVVDEIEKPQHHRARFTVAY